MKTNKIIFFTLALFMGAAHRQSFAMEQPKLQRNRRTAQAFNRVLYSMIRKLPISDNSNLAEIQRFKRTNFNEIFDISALIQATRLNPSPENAAEIKKKKIGDFLYEIAQRNNHPATMAWLLDNNLLNLNAQERFKINFGEYAIKPNFSEAEFLLRHGAYIDQGSPTILLKLTDKTISKNNWDEIEFLITHGANPNAQDPIGNTPLNNLIINNMYHLRGLPAQMIKKLIICGASPHIINRAGKSPLDYLHEILISPWANQARQALAQVGLTEDLEIIEPMDTSD